MTEAMTELILLHARQVLCMASKIDAEEEVCSSAKLYVKVLEQIEVRRGLDV